MRWVIGVLGVSGMRWVIGVLGVIGMRWVIGVLGVLEYGTRTVTKPYMRV
jgi:hypothetical protein